MPSLQPACTKGYKGTFHARLRSREDMFSGKTGRDEFCDLITWGAGVI